MQYVMKLKKRMQNDQPVLVGTITIETSELLSEYARNEEELSIMY